MLQYIIKRLLLMIPTVLGAAFVIFFILRIVPGDVCQLKMGGDGGFFDPRQVEICRESLGLNQPMWQQFLTFVYGIFTFDFGNSLDTGKPVLEEIGLRFARLHQEAKDAIGMPLIGGDKAREKHLLRGCEYCSNRLPL